MKVRHGQGTDVGLVRTHNEDAVMVAPPLFAVADGMGGHHAGEVASSTAVDALRKAAGTISDESPADPDAWLTDTIRRANTSVYDRGSEHGGLLRMGTTLTAALVTDNAVWLGHVGDSRAYRLHDGQLGQLTDDHSLVGEWVREGRLSADEAAVHPQRSVITRALGIDPDIDVETHRVHVAVGDRILLCSDGLTSTVADDRIAEVLVDVDDPQQAVQSLIELACAHGGDDNVTAVLLNVTEAPDLAPADEAAPAAAAAAARQDAGTARSTVTTGKAPRGTGGARTASWVAPPGHDDGTRHNGARRTWLRIGAAVAGFALLIAAIWLGVAWLLDRTYFVGADGNFVAIYQGVPDGPADPTLVETSGLRLDSLPQNLQRNLRRGVTADDLEDARGVVIRYTVLTTTTTTTTTTTSTLPPAPPVDPGAPPAPPGAAPAEGAPAPPPTG